MKVCYVLYPKVPLCAMEKNKLNQRKGVGWKIYGLMFICFFVSGAQQVNRKTPGSYQIKITTKKLLSVYERNINNFHPLSNVATDKNKE